MSGTFNKLFEKGKAKVKEFSTPSSSSYPGYPGQGHHGHQGQPPPQQYSGHPYPPQQPYPPSPYNAPPPDQYSQYPQYNAPPPQQQWGPPPNQWGGPPPQNQWKPSQALSPPPVPTHSKPQSPQPPPIPSNHPPPHSPSMSFPGSQSFFPSHDNKVYWRPSFDQSVPVAHNFRHEIGAHGWGNNESQNYIASPQNSFHTPDGRLVIRAISQNGEYTSARLTSHQTLSRPKGYVAATIYPPCAEGIWPAFWILPKDPFQWPNDGEVDIFESWNGDCVNHSCLHWGHYNSEDWNKHRVVETHLSDMRHMPHTFGLAWIEEEGIPDWRGRLIWYIDGRPVMKGNIPLGTRRMEDFRILLNVAMGGNVCGGKLPRNGSYDLVISDLKMCEEPTGGWSGFERAWECTPEGNPN